MPFMKGSVSPILINYNMTTLYTGSTLAQLLTIGYSLLEVLIVLVPVLLAVAFMTIIERKVLAGMQRRIGPNVVGYYGTLQPFADALKLVVKEMIIPQHATRSLFFLAPIISLVFSLLG
jgi:NADH:ubiquinone oxidoreductase subunit H